MQHSVSRVIRSIFVLMCLQSLSTPSFANEDLQRILNLPKAPDGVVFEIVESDEEALSYILPKIKKAIEQVRKKFPETEFAVVSHGSEQFALESRYQQSMPEIHRHAQTLVEDEIPVHVCGTHAGWYGVNAEDFPDYVDVAPTGPGQIKLYIEMGYELVVMD